MSRLLARATRDEQFPVLGELRQGALEGLMVEAVAQAAALPVAEIRRALMVSGNLGAVARAALTEGQHGLARTEWRALSGLGVLSDDRRRGVFEPQIRSQRPVSSSSRSSSRPLKSKRDTIPITLPSSTIGTWR